MAVAAAVAAVTQLAGWHQGCTSMSVRVSAAQLLASRPEGQLAWLGLAWLGLGLGVTHLRLRMAWAVWSTSPGGILS